MSNDTPMTDAEHTRLVRISEGPDWIAGKDYVDMRKHSETLERENARLREEVEMLNVRHAVAMLHAQTHADEYNALREDEYNALREDEKGLLQDIQRLTEEAFKRDEELAEAKRDTGLAKLVIQQKQDQISSAEAALEQAEDRALVAEKDAERYRLLRSRIEVPGAAAKFLALNNWHPSTDLHDIDAVIDAAIAGAKHEA